MSRLTDKNVIAVCAHCNSWDICKPDDDCFVKEVYKKLKHLEDLEEQGRLIDTERAVDFGYLSDWYISSVNENDEPVWTEKHIEELTNDFILIPKTEDAAETMVAKWTDDHKCSKCSYPALLDGGEEYVFSRFCPNCGAKMDEVEE